MKTLTVSTNTPIRINKYLSDQGIVSRRKADNFIERGLVSVNGKPITLGTKVSNGDKVTVSLEKKTCTYALYMKPKGEVTGRIPSLHGCEPVGRLDKESEGLLLYTDDYRVVDALLNPKHAREKEYEITIREKATPRVVTILKRGITTQEATYSPVKSVHIYNEGYSLRIILTEGKKHEIRRMLNALNLTILSLKRVRIMSFVSHGIAVGKAHILTEKQKERLLKDLAIT
ncbi:MAG: rRNA pseudouridine2604 synthase [Patescibacteria group bacterium]|nr:rRNA pseudouridine2604 synthase [Patescibacteria group bacterium]